MIGHFGEERSPDFTAMIEGNMAAEEAPIDQEELRAGGAVANMRLFGGHLTRLELEDDNGQPRSVLYAPPNLAKPKLAASHAMLPVGEYDGAGGRHGIARWLDYGVTKRNECPLPVSSMVRTEAQRCDLGVEITRTLSLTPNELAVTTKVRNLGRTGIRTSMGEHFYFSVPEGSDVHEARLRNSFLGDSLALDDVLGQGAADRISQGEAQFWPGYGGLLEVDLPGRQPLALSANVTTITPRGRTREVTEKGQMGLLFWQRKGPEGGENPPFLCIEPTYGFDQTEEGISNDGIEIPPHGGAIALHTTISTRLYL